MRIRYLLAPGWVVSKNDGDRHYIDIVTLARLYGLRPGEWDRYDPDRDRDTDLPVLWPSWSGDYTLPLDHGEKDNPSNRV